MNSYESCENCGKWHGPRCLLCPFVGAEIQRGFMVAHWKAKVIDLRQESTAAKYALICTEDTYKAVYADLKADNQRMRNLLGEWNDD